ncbi:MAG: hypothetical protein IT564_11210 [Rhodospirillales bacterium]|nr:hypothetical protein [Rhodospirillales bacterium]
MIRPFALIGQAVTYAVFAAVLGIFANGPAHAPTPPEKAQIVLSLIHGGKPAGECRERTAEELAKLAPNMRRKLVCPRERVALLIELKVDGNVLFRDALPPKGLAKDFPSHIHRRFAVEPGARRIEVRLRDSNRREGFDYAGATEATLAPRQSLAIEFRAAAGGFTFR